MSGFGILLDNTAPAPPLTVDTSYTAAAIIHTPWFVLADSSSDNVMMNVEKATGNSIDLLGELSLDNKAEKQNQ